MKHIKLFFLVLAMSLFCACEKPTQETVVTVTHEIIQSDTHEIQQSDTIAFIATAQPRPVVMFYWWIRRNGTIIKKVAGNSLSEYDGSWTSHYTDTVFVKATNKGVYSATLEYYDGQDKYFVGDEVTIQ